MIGNCVVKLFEKIHPLAEAKGLLLFLDKFGNIKLIDFDRIHKYNTKLYNEYYSYID